VRALGLHLLQSVDLVDTPRRSVIVEMDAAGAVARIAYAATTDEVVAAVGAAPALVAVDAPLVVPNETGQRDVERILAWCDAPTFPVSSKRLLTVHGGARGVELADVFPTGVAAAQTHPDLALRLMMWEADHPGGAIDLADYRAQWLGLRAPIYRPKGAGRARPDGIVAAAAIVARQVDLGGWTPTALDDDWGPIADAGVLDAVLCAWVAHRALDTPERVMTIGSPRRGEMLLPVDANLRARLEATVARLAGEGTIAAPSIPA
jgi:predicted nuclease with RNAse H fold